MGFGLPAAIGVQFAHPKETVIDIAGDGSIQMNIQELATISQHELPIKIAILNNGYLGMVRQWQEFFFGKRYAATCLRKGPNCPETCNERGEQCPPYVPDFIKLAGAYYIKGIRVEKKEDVEGAIKEALSIRKPVLMEFLVNPEENVTPMVPAGAPLHKMISSREDAEQFLLA